MIKIPDLELGLLRSLIKVLVSAHAKFETSDRYMFAVHRDSDRLFYIFIRNTGKPEFVGSIRERIDILHGLDCNVVCDVDTRRVLKGLLVPELTENCGSHRVAHGHRNPHNRQSGNF